MDTCARNGTSKNITGTCTGTDMAVFRIRRRALWWGGLAIYVIWGPFFLSSTASQSLGVLLTLHNLRAKRCCDE